MDIRPALRGVNNALTTPRRLPNPFLLSLHERVAGKTVLITGASSGIGRALARRVAAAGAMVIVTARRIDELATLCADIEADGGVAHAISSDLATTEGVDSLADAVLAAHGAPDIFVSNAGRSIVRSIAEAEFRLHDYERTMRVNYLGAVGLTLRLLPGMRERGSGHVVHSGSIGVQANLPRFSAYVGSKAALDAFLRVAAVESYSDNIKFTTVYLPLTDTDMIGPTGWSGYRTLSVDEAVDMLVDAIRRQPDEVAVPLGALAAAGTRFAPESARRALNGFQGWMPGSRQEVR